MNETREARERLATRATRYEALAKRRPGRPCIMPYGQEDYQLDQAALAALAAPDMEREAIRDLWLKLSQARNAFDRELSSIEREMLRKASTPKQTEADE